MTIQQWAIMIGVAASVLLALLPWMFRVWGKLAEVSTRMKGVTEDIQEINATLSKLFDSDRKRLPHCLRHEAKLEDHDRRLTSLEPTRRDP